MRELLEKWSAHEPERVHIGPPLSDIGADIRLGGLPLWVPFGAPSAEASAFILAATIEAITARGWEWSLWSDGNEVSGDITIRDDDTNLGRVHGSGLKQLSTPAEALLTAYLNAVEAQS